MWTFLYTSLDFILDKQYSLLGNLYRLDPTVHHNGMYDRAADKGRIGLCTDENIHDMVGNNLENIKYVSQDTCTV